MEKGRGRILVQQKDGILETKPSRPKGRLWGRLDDLAKTSAAAATAVFKYHRSSLLQWLVPIRRLSPGAAKVFYFFQQQKKQREGFHDSNPNKPKRRLWARLHDMAFAAPAVFRYPTCYKRHTKWRINTQSTQWKTTIHLLGPNIKFLHRCSNGY